METKIYCPICEKVSAKLVTYTDSVTYRNKSSDLEGFQRYECEDCAASFANSEAMKNNKRIVLAYHKHVDGYLSGAEVRAIRKKLLLSQHQASKIFGGGPVAFSKYENDEVVQSEAMDKLIRIASESQEAYQILTSWAIPATAVEQTPLEAFAIEAKALEAAFSVEETPLEAFAIEAKALEAAFSVEATTVESNIQLSEVTKGIENLFSRYVIAETKNSPKFVTIKNFSMEVTQESIYEAQSAAG